MSPYKIQRLRDLLRFWENGNPTNEMMLDAMRLSKEYHEKEKTNVNETDNSHFIIRKQSRA